MVVENGEISLRGRKILVPMMEYASNRTIAAVIEGLFDAEVIIMPSGSASDLKLGKRFSSGKECFPYIQTLADLLTHVSSLKQKGEDLEDYLYLIPQAHGPCRFGQYHKCHDLILESLGHGGLRIVSPTSKDAYTLGGQITKTQAGHLRRLSWNAIVLGDVLNRMLWRTRPYEKRPGLADRIFEESLTAVCARLRATAASRTSIFASYRSVLNEMEQVGRKFSGAMKAGSGRRPRVAIIGEIYMRSHTFDNQELVRRLEGFGLEALVASTAEWVNYTTQLKVDEAAESLRLDWAIRGRVSKANLKDFAKYYLTRLYQHTRMHIAYDAASRSIDIPHDHTTSDVLRSLDNNYHTAIYGEAVLSIASALTFMQEGYSAVVNCMPFGCMPSNNADAVLRELCSQRRFPYLSVAYDDTVQPARDESLAILAHKAIQYQNSHVLQSQAVSSLPRSR